MISYFNEIIYILRIVIAGICGIIIGVERKNRLKEAGLRTHCLVACASALMMILSKYAFFDLSGGLPGIKDADPARIAAQVVSGIGFLGAGMIFVHKNTISGLTTAAGIWTTAGIGMAMGAGMYITGIAATIIVVIVQTVLHLNIDFLKVPVVKVLNIYNVNEENYQNFIINKLNEKGITVHDISIKKTGENNGKCYTLYIGIPNSINEEELISLIDCDAEIKSNI